jgi:hypothetical protein
VIAVLAGGLVATVLFQVGAVIAFVSLYGIPLGASPGPPGVRYFAMNLGFAALAAMVAGWVTARVARPRPRPAVGALAVVLAAVALWGFTKPASQWPRWYPVALGGIAVAGTVLGGVLRLRRP